MDPNNPLRGPRRALRRGEPPLRYDRLSYPDVAEAEEAGRGRQARGADEGGPLQNDRLVMQRMREEIWNNDDDSDDDDGRAQVDSDDDDLIESLRMTYDDEEVDDSMIGRGQHPGRLPGIRDGDLVEADSDDDEDDDPEEGHQLGEEEEEEEDGQEGEMGEEEDDVDGVEEDDEGADEYLYLQGDLPDGDEAGMLAFDPMSLGLKEINNLAHFSVSSHKPGNGVEELLNDDLDKFWQSDGPQPHLLTIHFLRRVEIRAIRLFVDYNQDESYTPTSVSLSAGTGHHDLLEFSTLALNRPVGWQEINLSDVGGGADGNSLCCWIVQVRVKENHQNGKDTHIRGIKLYGIDENAIIPLPVVPPMANTATAGGGLDELTRLKMQALQQHQMKGGLASMRGVSPILDPNDYIFEQLLMQSPERLAGQSDRSGTKSNLFRDMEIR
ncbi:anaphase-promoting complex subunit 10 [Ophiostoma piceae UAMH 11346]|uniref:Anaphase-promoting complex subunit 10 n=1 Tax=Ophiostoma piceae (strain UAMH 11346) TaxID=1262450 RepID=S3CJ08_OPHP1|nr:anaphase-promoting complex subunit 10 [Ophiostoma piceae UAMH 11346]